MINACDAIAILAFLKDNDASFGEHLAHVCGVDSHEREFICDRLQDTCVALACVEIAREEIRREASGGGVTGFFGE